MTDCALQVLHPPNKVHIAVRFHSNAHFTVLSLLLAGVKTYECSSWVWSRGSGGHWLCFVGSVTGYSVRCGHLSISPTCTVLGKLKKLV